MAGIDKVYSIIMMSFSITYKRFRPARTHSKRGLKSRASKLTFLALLREQIKKANAKKIVIHQNASWIERKRPFLDNFKQMLALWRGLMN